MGCGLSLKQKTLITSINFKDIMQDLAQITLDILGVFIMPFIVTLVISWVVSLFRYK